MTTQSSVVRIDRARFSQSFFDRTQRALAEGIVVGAIGLTLVGCGKPDVATAPQQLKNSVVADGGISSSSGRSTSGSGGSGGQAGGETTGNGGSGGATSGSGGSGGGVMTGTGGVGGQAGGTSGVGAGGGSSSVSSSSVSTGSGGSGGATASGSGGAGGQDQASSGNGGSGNSTGNGSGGQAGGATSGSGGSGGSAMTGTGGATAGVGAGGASSGGNSSVGSGGADSGVLQPIGPCSGTKVTAEEVIGFQIWNGDPTDYGETAFGYNQKDVGGYAISFAKPGKNATATFRVGCVSNPNMEGEGIFLTFNKMKVLPRPADGLEIQFTLKVEGAGAVVKLAVVPYSE